MCIYIYVHVYAYILYIYIHNICIGIPEMVVRYLKMGGLQWKIPVKWMIGRYASFRKPPYISYDHKYVVIPEKMEK